MTNSNLTPERVAELERIKELEKNKMWEVDSGINPPSKELFPNKVDYLNKKLHNKIACKIANKLGTKFFEQMIKDKKLIIKDIVGIENFTKIEGGAILTCNHFNIRDNYIVYKVIKPYIGKKELYKVIREGNYTSMPGLFGFLFRHCNTLPLSSNTQTMRNFLKATKILLARGEKILIYPEQGMWWNYRKPKPLKPGAFNLAVSNKAPVVPFFIAMEDSDILDDDGSFVQEYTVFVSEPIYPNPELSSKENQSMIEKANYNAWKQIYEKFYNTPLTY